MVHDMMVMKTIVHGTLIVLGAASTTPLARSVSVVPGRATIAGRPSRALVRHLLFHGLGRSHPLDCFWTGKLYLR